MWRCQEKGLDYFAVAAERIGREFGAAVGFVLTGDGPFKKSHDRHLPNMFSPASGRRRSWRQSTPAATYLSFLRHGDVWKRCVEAMGSGLPVYGEEKAGFTGSRAPDQSWVFGTGMRGVAAGMRQLLYDESLRSRLRFGAC
jgi:hypothetical protein